MKKPWVITLIAAASMAIVIAAGFLTARITKTDADGWIEAFATTAALGAAVAAALLVARTVGIELDREEARLVRERSAQAALVAAWHEPKLVEMWEEDQDGHLKMTGYNEIVVMMRNASPVPVTNFTVIVAVRIGPSRKLLEQRPADLRGSKLFNADFREPVLPPNDEPAVRKLKLEPPIRFENVGGPDALSRAKVMVAAWFVDATGIQWSRDASGLYDENPRRRKGREPDPWW